MLEGKEEQEGQRAHGGHFVLEGLEIDLGWEVRCEELGCR